VGRWGKIEKHVAEILKPYGTPRVRVCRGGEIRADVQLNKPLIILPAITELKERFPKRKIKIRTEWTGQKEGIGSVRLFINHTYLGTQLINRSRHETKGKQFLLSVMSRQHAGNRIHHDDDVEVYINVRNNGSRNFHATDLDLVWLDDKQYSIGEILTGKGQKIQASLRRKVSVWNVLSRIIPINKRYVLIYWVAPSLGIAPMHLKNIENILRKYNFGGRVWITNPSHSKFRRYTVS